MAKIQNTNNTKCWRGYGAISYIARGMQTGTTIWKTVWEFLMKLNILLRYDPAIASHCIYTKSWKLLFTQNLHLNIYSNFIHNCQILDVLPQGMHKLWYIQTVEHSKLKRNKLPSHTKKSILLNERSNLKRATYYDSNSMTFRKRQTMETVKGSVSGCQESGGGRNEYTENRGL